MKKLLLILPFLISCTPTNNKISLVAVKNCHTEIWDTIGVEHSGELILYSPGRLSPAPADGSTLELYSANVCDYVVLKTETINK